MKTGPVVKGVHVYSVGDEDIIEVKTHSVSGFQVFSEGWRSFYHGKTATGIDYDYDYSNLATVGL